MSTSTSSKTAAKGESWTLATSVESAAGRPHLEGQTVVVIGGSASIGLETASFDAGGADALKSFFLDLASPIDHVMVTAGAPHYGPPLEMTPEEAAHSLTEHALLALNVARCAVGKVKPCGSLIFMGGTGGRRLRVGMAIVSTATVGLPTLIASRTLEIAPIRVNLIAAGFVDTPLSASCWRRS